MKKFFKKFINTLSFKKKKEQTLDDELSGDITEFDDEFEENFDEDAPTDPSIQFPELKTSEDRTIEKTLPDLTRPDLDIPEIIPEEEKTGEFTLEALEDENEYLEEEYLSEEEDEDGPEKKSFFSPIQAKLTSLFKKKSVQNEVSESHEDNESEDFPPQKISPFVKLKTIFKKRRPSQSTPPEAPEKKPLKKTTKQGFIPWFFSVQARPTLHRYFLLLLILLFFYGLGKTLGFFMMGTKVPRLISHTPSQLSTNQSYDFSRNDLNKLGSQDIFFTKVIKTTPKPTPVKKDPEKTKELCLKANKKTNFPYYLHNTIVLQNAKKSVASIQVRSDMREFREGMVIDNRARIDRIGRLKVILKNLNNNRCEHITSKNLDKSSSPVQIMKPEKAKKKQQHLAKIQGIENNGNKITIKKSFLNEKLKNISSLLTEALAIPVSNPDGTVSFRITQIEPGSLFSYLNIENDDVITQINGKTIKSQNEVLNLFAKIKNISKLQLTVNRGGSPQELDYMFK